MKRAASPMPPFDQTFNWQPVQVPDALAQDIPKKSGLIQKIMPFMMFGVMAVMMGVMIFMGTRGGGNTNPMMYMSFLMMLPMMLMPLMARGQPNDKLAQDRQGFFLEIEQAGKAVNAQAETLHEYQCNNFPNPATLAAYITANPATGAPSIWRYGCGTQGGIAFGGDALGTDMSPYLAARVGIGNGRLRPELDTGTPAIAEQCDPLANAVRQNFIQTHQAIPHIPMVQSMFTVPVHTIAIKEGVSTHEQRLALVRAMVCGMMFNHAPSELRVAVIADNPGDTTWSWVKWLPHVASPVNIDPDSQVISTMVYRSVSDFLTDNDDLLSSRPGFSDAASDDLPKILVLVDTPLQDFTATDIDHAGVTSLVVRSRNTSLSESNRCDTLVLAHELRLYNRSGFFAHADQMSLDDAVTFARKMSAYEVSDFVTGYFDSPSERKAVDFYSALGIYDIDTTDFYARWERSNLDDNLEVPLGLLTTGRPDDPQLTDSILSMNFAEAAQGGTGPHIGFQGATGQGKSFLLSGVIASIAALFSPEKVALVLCDFKGGSTFRGFEALPHVVANISNLTGASDLVTRMNSVIDGELDRRQELLDTYGMKDIYAYRRAARNSPDKYPEPLPFLLLVFDEYSEFTQVFGHNVAKEMLARVGRVGRSLGVHALPTSQTLSESLLGSDLTSNMMAGISMHVSKGSESSFLVKAPTAASIPAYHAVVYQGQGTHCGTTVIKGFDNEAPVIRRSPAQLELDKTLRGGDGRLVAMFDAETDWRSVKTSLSHKAELAASARADDASEVVLDVTMKDALLKAISTHDRSKVRQLWQPSLRVPITFNDLDLVASNTDLNVAIGLTDDPHNHARYVWTHPFRTNGSCQIIGDPGTGSSTILETMVLSAAASYSPSELSFCLLDYGVRLIDIAASPNVNVYCRKANQELEQRLLAEVASVVAYRQQALMSRGLADIDPYLESRTDTDKLHDPYGRLVVMIDGLDSMREERRAAGGDISDITGLLTNGPAVGVYVIATCKKTITGVCDRFPLTIQLRCQDTQMLTSSVLGGIEMRKRLSDMPAAEPGRVIDLTTGLYQRAAVPIADPITPSHVDKGLDMYDYNVSHSGAITAMCASLAQAAPVKAVPIETVQRVISFTDFLGETQAVDGVYLGKDSGDLSLVPLPTPASGNRLFTVLGELGSGRTNLLRTLMYSIVAHERTPQLAQFYVFDPNMNLLDVRDNLQAFISGYVVNPTDEAGTTAIERLVSELSGRIPRDPSTLTADMIRDRSWYSGRNIYIIMDDVERMRPSPGGADPLAPIISLMGQTYNIGLTVISSVLASRWDSMMSDPFRKTLNDKSAPLMLMSASRDIGTGIPGVKFLGGQPAGRGQVYRTGVQGLDGHTVQTPLFDLS